jgi:hypothetical protein
MFRPLRAALAVVPLVAACSGSSHPAAAEIVTAELDPHPVSAVSAVLHVTTTAPTTVSLTVAGASGAFDVPADHPATDHTIPVVGMHAETDYTVIVHARPAGGGDVAEERLPFHTGALPADLPPITVTTSQPARMEPGVTVVNATNWAPVDDAGYIIAVDATGAIVWYDRIPQSILDVDTTPRGTFLVTVDDAMIEEVDLLGTVVRKWGTHISRDPGVDPSGRQVADAATTDIDIDSSHHEVTELPDGDILTLSTELIEIPEADAQRLCPDKPNTSVVGDVVVELSPKGEVVQRWPISAIYDPTTTPGTEMCAVGIPLAPPNWFYPQTGGTQDWTHANAIALDSEHNTLIVSLRHFDRVVGLRYHDDGDGKAGELLWSLGVGGTIDLTGEPSHHQHALELEADGSMMMYDNGNMRPGTVLAGGTEPAFSRAVRYQVDLASGRAVQVWEHRDTWPDGRPVYTPFLGDVDLEPNGNVLITHGGGSSASGSLLGRIIEVVPGDQPDGSADQTVFDITVGDGTSAGGWTVYRSERLPSLYFGS